MTETNVIDETLGLDKEAIKRLQNVAEREAEREAISKKEEEFNTMLNEIKSSDLVVKSNLTTHIDTVLEENPHLKKQGKEGATTLVKFAEQLSRNKPKEVEEQPVQIVQQEQTDVSKPTNNVEHVGRSEYAQEGDPDGLVRKAGGHIDFKKSHISAFAPEMKAMARSRGCRVN